MSSYYSSFNYMGINSLKDKKLIVTHFDVDNGESDTFLDMEPVYTESSDGTRRIDYGAKFSSVAVVKITVIKEDASNFTVDEVRDFLRWTTGVRQNSYLDLLENDEIKFSFLGRVTNAFQQKMDARTIGLAIEFTSVSPWAYSPVQTISRSFIRTEEFSINNESDDLYSYVYMKIKYENKIGDSLIIENTTTGDKTEVTGLAINEVITIDNNMMITSDNPAKTFGNTFNFVFPRLAAGVNNFNITANGQITFEYIYPIKIGDCAIDVISSGSGIGCGGSSPGGGGGTVIVEELSWENITNKPTTIAGFGITDAYTIEQIDRKFSNITNVDINEQELNAMLAEVLA